jgi:hypothetical protein
MANVKISALPSYTGTAADIRYFVMNNSGETETFKYSGYTSPYRWNSSTSAVTEVNITKSTQFNTRGGTNTETVDSYSNFVVGTGNTVGNVSTQHVVFGEGNTATGGADSVGAFVFGKNNSTTNASQRWGAMFGAYNSLGASTGYIFGINNLNIGFGSICIGENHVMAGEYSSAIGGNNRIITSYNHSISNDGDIESGNYNGIYGGDNMRNNSGSYNGFLGGKSNTNNTSSYGGFIGGESNTITGSGSRNVMVGGSGNTISGKTDVVMLGTTGRTALYDNTTHVENSHNFKTESFGVTNVGSVGGSIDVDCSLGTLFYFTITANTTPNFINWKEGQRIQFYVDNSGSFTVPTATITGGGSVYAKSGSLNPTNNEITAYYGTIVNGNMFLDEHLNFQPV